MFVRLLTDDQSISYTYYPECMHHVQSNVRMWKNELFNLFTTTQSDGQKAWQKNKCLSVNTKQLWCGRTFFISPSNSHGSTAESRARCAFSPSHLSVWPPLTHTDRQTNRQTHTHTHTHARTHTLYFLPLVKFFEGNIIHYNMQLPCNALATIQSFNSGLQSMQEVCVSKRTPETD